MILENLKYELMIAALSKGSVLQDLMSVINSKG